MIYVSGASGVTGGELVRQLRALGAPVRALVHHPENAAPLEDLGAEIALGDTTRPNTLAAGLEGVERLFLLSPPNPELVAMEGNLVDAAREAGVRHVVKHSVMGAGAESPALVARLHAESERIVGDSGLDWTLLRPNAFMQNMLQNAPMIAVAGMIYAPMGDGRLSYVDARDVAAVATVALTEDGHDGRTYELTGPEALSNYDVADSIAAAIGKPVTYADVPAEEAHKGMLEMGLPDWYADDLIRIYDLWKHGAGEGVTDDLPRVAGRAATSYDEFARDHAAVFRGEAAI